MSADTDAFNFQDDPSNTLTKADIAIIKAMIDSSVKKSIDQAFTNHKTYCRFNVDESDEKSISHFTGMLHDISDKDSASNGVEKVREAVTWVEEVRKTRNKVGNLIIGAFILAVTGGLFAAVWEGVKALMEK